MFTSIKRNFKNWNIYHNPYYWWWRARKYFKRPKANLVCGKYGGYFGLPCRTDSYRKGLEFFCEGLGWKDKYHSPRHEWDPIICFVWTNPWKTWHDNQYSRDIKHPAWWQIVLMALGWHDPGIRVGYYSNDQYWFGFTFNWIKKPDPDHNYDTQSMATWEAILDHVVYEHDIKWCYEQHQWGRKDEEVITIKDNLKRGERL